VADRRATTHARPGLELYVLLERRGATDRRVAELDRSVQQLSAPGALSDEAVGAIDVLCAAIQEITELRDALERVKLPLGRLLFVLGKRVVGGGGHDRSHA
jgi:hypothetical protein